MRIVFICGSLEEGKDGVGDYTRQLAMGLVADGHSAFCIALNDQFIPKSDCASRQRFDLIKPQPVEVRYSASSSYRTRFRHVRNLFHLATPDLISLQFVPYAYSASGIPWKFTLLLSSLLGKWTWHVMFHELWIGNGGSPKNFVISLCQMQSVKSLAAVIRPTTIHTSIHRYVNMLRGIGLRSSILPIHSSIRPCLSQPRPCERRSDEWSFVFFGSLDSQWQAEPFFEYIETARKTAGIKRCRFVRIGHINESGIRLWRAISGEQVLNRYPSFEFHDYGCLPARQVSYFLHHANFGVSMAPLQWIGKSSSVAAMIDHGLPVLVPQYRVSLDPLDMMSLPFADQLLLIDSDLPGRLRDSHKVKTANSVSRTIEGMLAALALEVPADLRSS